jgi:CubicO group peptidase (beta-lactamase class C family)
MLRRFSLLVVVAFGLSAGSSGAEMPPPAWPTRGWATSSPEAHKMDSNSLKALDQEIAAGKYGYIDGFLVVRHGQLVFERSYKHDYQKLFVGRGTPGIYNYFDPGWHPYYKGTDLHTMQSVSKTVTSTLIGIAILRGEIPGVNIKVMPYFAGFKTEHDPRRDSMTLAHVLTMTTGIAWDESSDTDPKNNNTQMEASEDWIQYVLDQPMVADPGKVFVYSGGATELLSYILEQATGKHADDYARDQLFTPLGIETFYWKRTPKGLTDTEGGLYFRPRDLAKFGYLFLNDGVWDGKRLLPEGWVRDATARKVRKTDWNNFGYGYKWWVISQNGPTSYDAYAASGHGGQRLIVVPELELIVTVTAWNIYDERALTMEDALDRVIAAVQDRPR